MVGPDDYRCRIYSRWDLLLFDVYLWGVVQQPFQLAEAERNAKHVFQNTGCNGFI